MKSITMYILKKRFKPLVWLLFLLFCFDLKSQTVKTNMTSSFYTTYCYRENEALTNYTFVPTDNIGGSPTTLNFGGNNDGSVEITLPNDFDFIFYCEKVNKIRISPDGIMLLDDAVTTIPSNNFGQLKSIKSRVVAPFYDELQLGTGSVTYEYRGVKGSTVNPYRLVVHWNNVSLAALNNSNVKLDFWAEYLEGADEIMFYYKDVQVIDDITDPNDQIIIGSHEFGKDASFGLRGICGTGDFLDKVNNAANAIQNGVSLKDFAVPEYITAFLFKPVSGSCPLTPIVDENFTVCEDVPAFDLPIKTAAINGNWEGSGVAYVTPNPATTSDINGIVAKFDPRDPGNFTVKWNPGCPLFSYNVNVRVDDRLNILTPVAQLSGCGRTSFIVQGENPSVVTVPNNPFWSKASGTTTLPIFPTQTNPITVTGVSGNVGLEWTNGTCKTPVQLRNILTPPPLPNIVKNDCDGIVDLSITALGASDFSWTLIDPNPAPANIQFTPNLPSPISTTSDLVVTGLSPTDVITLVCTYKSGISTCAAQPFLVSGGGAEQATVNNSTNAEQTFAQCNNGTFVLTAINPTLPTVGKWEFVGAPPAGVTMNPSVSPNNPVTISNVPTGVDVKVRWVIGIPSGSTLTCPDTVTVTLKNFPPVTAQVNPSITEQCGSGTFTLSAVNPTPFTGFWTIISGNGFISSPSSFLTSISGVTDVTEVKWVVYSSSLFGSPCRDSVKLILKNNPKPVAALGVFPTTKCNNPNFVVTGIVPATPVGTKGEWHYASDKSLISVNATTGVTVPVGMIENIYWVVFTDKCRDSIFVTLRNDAPVTASVTAKNPQCNTPTFSIQATPAATGSWAIINGGPGTVTSPTSASTTVTSVTAGSTTIVRWTVTGGACPNSTADVTLRNDAPSSVNVGANIPRCESQGLMVNLAATVVGTGSWSAVPAAALSFGSPNNPSTSATLAAGSVGQTIVATFCATNGVCPQACDDLDIKIDKDVTASITVVPANAQCENGDFTLTGNTPSVFTSKIWSKVSSANNVTLPADLTQSVINVTNLPIGQSVTMQWTTTNGTCSSNAQVILKNIAKPKVKLITMDCMSPVNLDGLITELVGDGLWTAVGGGSFDGVKHTVLNGTTNYSTYTPTALEKACGKIELTLTVQNPGCPDVVSQTVIIKLGIGIAVLQNVNLSLAYDENNCSYKFDERILLDKKYMYFDIKVCTRVNKNANGTCDCLAGSFLPTTEVNSTYIGKEIGVQVSDACGNKATTCVMIEDKQKPLITCPKDVAVYCNTLVDLSADKPDKSLTGDLGLDGITPPAPAMDGSFKDCSQIVDQSFVDECSFMTSCSTPYTEATKPTIDDILACLKGTNVNTTLAQDLRNRMLTASGDIVKFIIRRWVAMDRYRNISDPCYQVIAIRRLPFTIVAPADVKYSCHGTITECTPNILEAPASLASSFTGYPFVDMNANGTFEANIDIRLNTEGARACGFILSERNDTFPTCKGSRKIVRTFTVNSNCYSGTKVVSQTIEVLDLTPPVVRSEYLSYEKVAKKYCYVDPYLGKLDKISYELVAKSEVLTNFLGKQIVPCGYDNEGAKKTLLALGDANDCNRFFVKFRFVACDHFCTKDLVTITTTSTTLTGRHLTTQDFTDANGVPNYVWEFSGYITAESSLFDASYTYGEGECFRQGANCRDITFTAKDVCGNAFAKQTFRVYMIDNQKPFVNCIKTHTTSLGTNGTDRIAASVFNNGSTDNCGIVGYKVRRMDQKHFDANTIDGYDCDQPALKDTCFRDYVEFTCQDVDSTIMVEMLAYDDNCNTNSCMVEVKVQNKNRPQCVAPATETTTCENIALKIGNPKAYFKGTADAFYNCGYKMEELAATGNLNNCGIGTVTRTWVVKNCANNAELSRCQQIINVTGKSDFSVDFPDDVVVSCQGQIPTIACLKQQMLDPTSWAKGYDGAIKNDGCGVLQISIKDDTLMANPNGLGCSVIYRKICVSDDCKYQPNASNSLSRGVALTGDVHGYSTNGKSLPCSVTGATTDPLSDNRRFRDADGLTGGNSDGIICYIQTIKIEDVTKPVAAVINDTTIGFIPKQCRASYRRAITATDGCTPSTSSSTGLRYNWFVFVKEINKNPNDFTQIASGETSVIAVDNLAAGTYFVKWSVKDLCNNSTPQYSYTLTVRDEEAPSIVGNLKVAALGGVPLGGNGMATVCVSDVLTSLNDNCTNATVLRQNARLVRQTTNFIYPASPGDTCVMINCSDLADSARLVLWTRDEAGISNYARIAIKVQDNLNACRTSGRVASMSGTILTDKNVAIQNAQITALIKGSNTPFATANTLSSGGFEINNLILGQSYDVRVAKEDEIYAGVTTFDISIISRHLLDIEKLKSPCSIIAADVDGNRIVDGADMLHLRNFILRKSSSLPAGAWKFVDKKYTFQNPNEPLVEDFPQIVSEPNVTQNLSLGFTAIKVGDVNNTYRPQTIVAPAPRSSNALIFVTDDMMLEAGKTYSIKLKSNDFKASDYQFTLGFTEGVAIIKSVEAGKLPNMGNSNFAVFKNAITTSWNGLAKEDEVEVLTLTFVASKNAQLSEVLTTNSAITPMDATNTEGAPLKVQLTFGNSLAKEVGEFALYQNRPNPMSNTTAIGFNLPKESEATLTVYNIEGKAMKVVNGTFKAGYNEVVVEKETFQTAGIYYYRLETSEHSATKKMVVSF
jgi:hypothetical protein